MSERLDRLKNNIDRRRAVLSSMAALVVASCGFGGYTLANKTGIEHGLSGGPYKEQKQHERCQLVVERYTDNESAMPTVKYTALTPAERIDCGIIDQAVSEIQAPITPKVVLTGANVQLPSIENLQEAADIKASSVSSNEATDYIISIGFVGGFSSMVIIGSAALAMSFTRSHREDGAR